MSSNLDMSLDEIRAERQRSEAERRGCGGRGRQHGAAGRGWQAGGAGPSGGVKKRAQHTSAVIATAPVTQARATEVPTGPSCRGESNKILISNLPSDVKEFMITDYFTKSIGHVRSCYLSYGPNGVSHGIVTLVFSRHGDAKRAAEIYNGALVDNMPMKVEMVFEPGPRNPATTFTKPAATPKHVTNVAPQGVTRGKRARDSRYGGSPRPCHRPEPANAKTLQELDADMEEYWYGSALTSASGGATGQQDIKAALADAMDLDEIL